MLTRFEVKGFKSLVDVAVDLGAVNVFIGANGSGKSNLLEAISFYGAVITNVQNTEAFRYRGVRTDNHSSYLSNFKDKPLASLSFSAIFAHSDYYTKLSPRSARLNDWFIESEKVRLEQTLIASRTETSGTVHISSSGKGISFDVNRSQSIIEYVPHYIRLAFNIFKQNRPEEQIDDQLLD